MTGVQTCALPIFNPLYAQLMILSAGFAAPEEKKCHCELGFGQGLSLNIHAAATGDTWYGNDFNPAQVSYAQKLAKISGADVHLYDDSFEDFLARRDLPQFDTINLHGIWSWINNENKHFIVHFIRDRLKPGGLVYVSYNTTPGWTGFLAVRNLMNLHANTASPKGASIDHRVKSALQFAADLFDTNPHYMRLHPNEKAKLSKLKSSASSYLAHEYFNQSWTPIFFSDLHNMLSAAKLDFACSATASEHIDEVNLTAQQKEFLATIENPVVREESRDLIVNQQFRRDFWIKGCRQLLRHEYVEKLRQIKVVLKVGRSQIELAAKGALGTVKLDMAQFSPILDLIENNQAISIGEIADHVSNVQMNFDSVVKVLVALLAMRYIAPAQETISESAKKASTRLNDFILSENEHVESLRFLCSPVTGGGIPVDRINALFLLGLRRGLSSASEIADFAVRDLNLKNQTVMYKGNPVRENEKLRLVMEERAALYLSIQVPVLKALKVI